MKQKINKTFLSFHKTFLPLFFSFHFSFGFVMPPFILVSNKVKISVQALYTSQNLKIKILFFV